MAYTITNLIGTKINRWTILEDLGRVNKIIKVKAVCDCGVIKTVGLLSITRNKTKSCGCLRSETNTTAIKN